QFVRAAADSSRTAPDLREPPAQPDEEEARVLEELGWLAFEAVADELTDPAEDEQRGRERPPGGLEPGGGEERKRHDDHRDPDRVHRPVDRMRVTRRILGDPFLRRAHGPPNCRLAIGDWRFC